MQTSGPQATTGRKAEGEVVIGVRPEGMGERIMLSPHHDQVHVFSPTTGERLD